MPDLTDGNTRELTVIARSLAALCLHLTEFRTKDLGQQAVFLQGLGLDNAEIADMLGSSENSIRVTLHNAKKKKKGRKTSGRKKG